jgi:iron complex transport system substrate-binding protein
LAEALCNVGAVLLVPVVAPSHDKLSLGGLSGDSVITDLAGRNVTLDLPVDTVVIADSPCMNAFSAVAGEDFLSYIVGLDSGLAKYYPALYEAYARDHPRIGDLPQVGSIDTSTFSDETVISLHPDVLILPLWAKEYGMLPSMERLEKAGIPVVFVDFYMSPYLGDSYQKSISVLGKLLGKEERADEIVEYYNEQSASSTTSSRQSQGQSPRYTLRNQSQGLLHMKALPATLVGHCQWRQLAAPISQMARSRITAR